MLLKDHIKAKYATDLQMTDEDVEELIEDLEDWEISTIQKFE